MGSTTKENWSLHHEKKLKGGTSLGERLGRKRTRDKKGKYGGPGGNLGLKSSRLGLDQGENFSLLFSRLISKVGGGAPEEKTEKGRGIETKIHERTRNNMILKK